MTTKYGFGGGLTLPAQEDAPQRLPVHADAIHEAVEAGNRLGFVNRDPVPRRKPGPKRREPQDKVSIPGPKRVTDRFRAFCTENDVTLWEGLEMLLEAQDSAGGPQGGTGGHPLAKPLRA